MRIADIVVICVITIFPCWSAENLMKNVTDEVFGSEPGKNVDLGDFLPVAFGDFNYDKFTDVFVVNKKRDTVKILLAKADALTSNHPSENTNGFQMVSNHLECQLTDMKIEAVLPADFDGDGAMDVLMVVQNDDDDDQSLYSFVIWGEYNKKKNYHLNCVGGIQGMNERWSKDEKGDYRIKMSTQPIVVLANGDYTADLFGSRTVNDSKVEEKGVWIFETGQRTVRPKFVPFPNNSAPIKRQFHSNAFIDVNQDGNSDILVLNNNNVLEVWKNLGSKGTGDLNFEHAKNVTIINSDKPNFHIGQMAFGDFDMDQQMDAVVPICWDESDDSNSFGSCKLLFSSLNDLFNGKSFQYIEINSGSDWEFDMPNKSELEKHLDIYTPLTPRIGDINLDGFPDMLIRMKNKAIPPQSKSQLFLNVASTTSDGEHSKLGRGFQMQSEVMEGIDSTTMATFFDLYEDGINDVISVQKFENEGLELQDNYRVGAFKNATKSNDAYFVKAIILTGTCYRNSCNGSVIGGGKDKVPFGTNIPGQKMCYQTEMLLGEKVKTIRTCASQLPQSSHSVLQLPYTIFGLGSSPNFIDQITVTVTNSSNNPMSHTWNQIIPNSQIYIVPYPPQNSDEWEIRLFVRPSHAILITALALLGVCLLTVMVIAILHWRERKQDLKEKLQDAQRFHFDAM